MSVKNSSSDKGASGAACALATKPKKHRATHTTLRATRHLT
jgi:hypothetical protein